MTDEQKRLIKDFAQLCAATVEIGQDLAQPVPTWATEWLSQFNRWNDRQQERDAAAEREPDDAMRRICEHNHAQLRAEAEVALEMLNPPENPRMRYFKEHSIASGCGSKGLIAPLQRPAVGAVQP
jgi:hypothetical protein